MYGWDICKNPEGYTWNKSTTTTIFYLFLCTTNLW